MDNNNLDDTSDYIYILPEKGNNRTVKVVFEYEGCEKCLEQEELFNKIADTTKMILSGYKCRNCGRTFFIKGEVNE